MFTMMHSTGSCPEPQTLNPEQMLSLARRFNGSFPVRDSTGMFERPNEDCMWFPFKGRMKVCDIKNIDRGIEKVDTCYGGDVSRLLDVCRYIYCP
jgi:hypothetical protein